MFDKVNYVIVVIICFVDYNRIFLKALDASTTIKIYTLTCISNLFQSMRTFVILVQICVVCCALKEISNIDNIYSYC